MKMKYFEIKFYAYAHIIRKLAKRSIVLPAKNVKALRLRRK